MRSRRTPSLVRLFLSLTALAAMRPAAAQEPTPVTYVWPVSGPVIRGFEPPENRFSAGHRGIDIGAPFGTTVVAAADGTVAFAGFVAGSRFVSVDHPDGVRTTYSWLSGIEVTRGRSVRAGQPIGATGHGHPEVERPHLHFGARVGEDYLDPLVLLSGSAAIHLAPLEESTVAADEATAGPSAEGMPPAATADPALAWLAAPPEPKLRVAPDLAAAVT